jgi:integrase/recombinase XerD
MTTAMAISTDRSTDLSAVIERIDPSGRTADQEACPSKIIERANLAQSTKEQYTRALERFFETQFGITDMDALSRRDFCAFMVNVDALAEHADTLSNSGRAFLKAAGRICTQGIVTTLKAHALPERIHDIKAVQYRLDAMLETLKTSNGKGTKAHTWLTQAEVKRLFDSCGTDIVGKRDRLALGLLAAAGLRRSEAAGQRFEDVRLQPVKQRFRTVLAVRGKGAKDRVVPISDALARAIDEWGAIVGGNGYILRALGMNREPGRLISGQGVFDIVAKRGKMIGKRNLQPHDLRRTYAQLGYEAGIPITQISRLLGHASIETTQRYLNLELDLQETISDFIPF